MKQKFFVYLLMLFFVNSTQNMNIISSLHNLEKKLTKLKPFLIGEKWPDSAEVSKLLAEFESHVDAIVQPAQNVDENFAALFNKIDLQKMQIGPSGEPINTIAIEVVKKIKLVFENYQKVMKNISSIYNIIMTVSNYFKKDLLTQNQKTKFISILTKFQNNSDILKRIAGALAQINLDVFQHLVFQTTLSGHEEVVAASFIKNLSREFYFINWQANFSTCIITFIKNDPSAATSLKNYIPDIKDLEQKVQNTYKQFLQLFEQVKQFASKSDKKQDLEKTFENLNNIKLIASLVDLFYFMKALGQCALFIKDNNLKKELLTALQSQDLKLSQKIKQEKNKLPLSSIPMIIQNAIGITIEWFERLENQIQQTESILKGA